MILLVDDELLNRKLLQWSLAKAGYEFVHAKNGFEAIEKVEQGDIEIILLDLMMPEMDGFGFLAWKNEARLSIREIPVIVNSALSDMESIKKALNMGAHDYFAKPLSSDDLEVLLPTKVRNAIEAAKAVGELRRRTEELNTELASAARYQTSMLPDKSGFAPLRFDYIYRPCSQVGGDFFDVFRLDDHRIAMLIGDVTGHGLKAGMMAFMVRSVFRELAARNPSPTTFVEHLNHTLCQVFETGHYLTGVYVLFDTERGVFEFANCGHPRPVLADGRGVFGVVEGGGNFLGILDKPMIEVSERPWSGTTGLMVYTDGVTETTDGTGVDLQTEGLRGVLESVGPGEPNRWCSAVWEELVRRNGSEEFKDDILLVACWIDPTRGDH